MEAFNHRVNTYIDSWMGPRGKTNTRFIYKSLIVFLAALAKLFSVLCSYMTNFAGLANGAYSHVIPTVKAVLLLHADDMNLCHSTTQSLSGKL